MPAAADLPPALALFDESFHEGVVGIVAGRVKDRLHRPTFVFARGADGQLGGKLRARVECEGGLIVQCALPLNEARELALDLAPAWNKAPAPVDAIVRRVELSPPKLRDPLTGLVSGRPDALEPEALHALFLARLDAWAAGARVTRENEED